MIISSKTLEKMAARCQQALAAQQAGGVLPGSILGDAQVLVLTQGIGAEYQVILPVVGSADEGSHRPGDGARALLHDTDETRGLGAPHLPLGLGRSPGLEIRGRGVEGEEEDEGEGDNNNRGERATFGRRHG